MRLAILLLVLGGLGMSQTPASPHHEIPAGIEKLHQADIAATLARDLDGLTALWDDDCVLLQPGHTPVVGKAAYREFAKESFAKAPAAKVLNYAPEFRDVQVSGTVAYEWGFFDLTFQPSEQEPPVSFRPTFMRVLKQQADGSWKFTRVMWMAE
jgi:ketosteroid isomerase-like protein